MSIDVCEEPLSALPDYGQISIAFEVDRILACALSERGLGGVVFSEEPVEPTYVKDYDAEAGGAPARWASRFDVSHWGLLAARSEGVRVGGAVIAYNTPGVDMLEQRRDLAVLWDLRVAPQARGRGVGTALFRAAEAWASQRGCRQLKIETQNNNVRACRFYVKQGCNLGGINRFAYPGLPGEVQLLWYKEL